MLTSKPSWFREAYTTRNLRRHENIIQYYGEHMFYQNHYFCIMEHGGETVYHKYYRKAEMEEEDIKRAMLHIARGIKHLHENHFDIAIIHRDVRTMNVTVRDNVYKLIDLGLSSTFENDLDSYLNSDATGHHYWLPGRSCPNGKNVSCLLYTSPSPRD